MKKTTLTALLLAGLTGTQAAHAINILNGESLNGVHLNGVHLNALHLNALHLNALHLNALHVNGLNSGNGLALNGVTPRNGMALQSSTPDCTRPADAERCRQLEAAPHFSAIQLARD
jgi:hypothetical protein